MHVVGAGATRDSALALSFATGGLSGVQGVSVVLNVLGVKWFTSKHTMD